MRLVFLGFASFDVEITSSYRVQACELSLIHGCKLSLSRSELLA
jgi:hypothetical protein